MTAGSSSDGYFYHCRSGSAERPDYISLNNVGYAKWLLRSATVAVCTSASKNDPPACGYHKFRQLTSDRND